jgi:hypothetical protein
MPVMDFASLFIDFDKYYMALNKLHKLFSSTNQNTSANMETKKMILK